MTKSRFLPLAVLSAAVALLLTADSGAPPGESGDAASAEPPAGPAPIAVDFVDDVDLDDVRAAARRAGVELAYATEVSADEALFSGQASDVEAALASFRADPAVESAEPVLEIRLEEDVRPGTPEPAPRIAGYPDDPMYPSQWNFALVNAAAGWRVGGGRGVVVAVIDTGVSALPDLPADRILPGRSFVTGRPTAADDNGHGTHVAGTIAQATNNGVGTAGIAPNATILPLKVLSGSGMGLSTWIAAAIDEAVDQGADVINLSLGGGHSSIIVTAVEKARAAGVVVVAAAGNTGRKGLGSPADATSAIAVTAVGPSDTLAPYSSWGKGVEISAPGGDKRVPGGGIRQGTIGDGGQQFAELQGTSMATPHVAGAAAVLLGAGAQSADEVERYLKAGAAAKDDPLRYGAGRLDISASVRRLILEKQGTLFGIGALLSLGLALLGGFPRGPRWAALLTGGVAAGGVFVLPFLPLPPNEWLALLGRPFMTWPGPFWSGFPIWQSCLLPLGLAFVLGPSRLLGPIALGMCGGVGAWLLYGAATRGTDLWWMPLGLDVTWLAINGTVTLLAGMAVAGMQKMRRA
jgi:serine protease